MFRAANSVVSAFVSFAFASVAAPLSARASAVSWDSAGAVVAGSGCRKDVDAFLYPFRSSLAVVFYEYGLRLGGGPLAGRANCTLRVPVTIPKGHYVRKVTTYFGADVEKSAGSEGRIDLTATFFNLPVVKDGRALPQGEAIGSPSRGVTLNRAHDADEQWQAVLCNPDRDERGMFGGNIVVSGQLQGPDERLVIDVGGSYIGYFNVEAEIAPCGG